MDVRTLAASPRNERGGGQVSRLLLAADGADRMRGGRRHEHQRAPADLARFRAGQHVAPPFHDDIYLLVRRVGVQRLLTAGLAFHPGDAELA